MGEPPPRRSTPGGPTDEASTDASRLQVPDTGAPAREGFERDLRWLPRAAGGPTVRLKVCRRSSLQSLIEQVVQRLGEPVVDRPEPLQPARGLITDLDRTAADRSIEGLQPICLYEAAHAAAVKYEISRSRSSASESATLIRVNSVLGPGEQPRDLARGAWKACGRTTVECCGQRIMITCGMSGGLSMLSRRSTIPSRAHPAGCHNSASTKLVAGHPMEAGVLERWRVILRFWAGRSAAALRAPRAEIATTRRTLLPVEQRWIPGLSTGLPEVRLALEGIGACRRRTASLGSTAGQAISCERVAGAWWLVIPPECYWR